MKDNIIKVVEEHGTMMITLKNGKKIPVKSTTKHTYWHSGRKDCTINIEEPINGKLEEQN